MKIYNVIQNDRHTDPSATPFIDKAAAFDFARRTAVESCKHLSYLHESEIDGWLFYIEYSSEGDCLYITEHDI